MNLRIACPKALQSEGTREALGIKAHINGPISVCTFCPFFAGPLGIGGGHTISVFEQNIRSFTHH